MSQKNWTVASKITGALIDSEPRTTTELLEATELTYARFVASAPMVADLRDGRWSLNDNARAAVERGRA